ncbi:MAG: hypothetical protein ACE5FJ_03235 [Gemmatimonadales bacterium]
MKKSTIYAMIGALVLSACSDSTGPDGQQTQVSLSFSTARPASAAPAPVSFFLSDTVVAGGDSLIITRARLVLREIELRRLSAPECMEEDDCEKFATGPLLVDLPLNGATAQAVSIAIPPDTYTEIEFEIHKPSNDTQADQDFIQQNPDFADASIRVEGTFNGTSFAFVTDLNEKQEFDLVPPLVVTETELSTNVTIRVDLAAWFADGQGGLVDPDSGNKGGANENLIKDNIRTSIEAFEDEDRDGDDTDED